MLKVLPRGLISLVRVRSGIIPIFLIGDESQIASPPSVSILNPDELSVRLDLMLARYLCRDVVSGSCCGAI